MNHNTQQLLNKSTMARTLSTKESANLSALCQGLAGQYNFRVQGPSIVFGIVDDDIGGTEEDPVTCNIQQGEDGDYIAFFLVDFVKKPVDKSSPWHPMLTQAIFDCHSHYKGVRFREMENKLVAEIGLSLDGDAVLDKGQVKRCMKNLIRVVTKCRARLSSIMTTGVDPGIPEDNLVPELMSLLGAMSGGGGRGGNGGDLLAGLGLGGGGLGNSGALLASLALLSGLGSAGSGRRQGNPRSNDDEFLPTGGINSNGKDKEGL
jgi:hypothetical protein